MNIIAPPPVVNPEVLREIAFGTARRYIPQECYVDCSNNPGASAVRFLL